MNETNPYVLDVDVGYLRATAKIAYKYGVIAVANDLHELAEQLATKAWKLRNSPYNSEERVSVS